MSFTCRYDNVIQPSIGVPDINRDVFSIIMHIAFCHANTQATGDQFLILGDRVIQSSPSRQAICSSAAGSRRQA
jgi:hypothetical protein